MVLEAWRNPSGQTSRSWLNVKHMMLTCLLIFKVVEWLNSSFLSYTLMLIFSYWAGFVLYRWLKRYLLAHTVASYKKAVLITGCDTGFGNLLAKRLAARGFQVLAGCLRPDSEDAARLATVPNVSIIGLDVTKEDHFKTALATVQERLAESGNDLWCVVCNSGVAHVAELEWQSMESIERMFDVNVMGVIRSIRTFLPMLRESKGRIVITASVASNIPTPGLLVYSMTKAAVASLGEGLKRELQMWDIDVCTVQPTLYKTPICDQEGAKNHFMTVEVPRLTENIRKDYGVEYFESFWNRSAKIAQDLASLNPGQAVAMLEHAVTTVWPETHYRVADWAQLLFYNLISILPVEATDLIFDLRPKAVEPNALVRREIVSN